MTEKEYLQKIAIQFKQAGNAQVAKEQSQYMRNRFPFFGLKKPAREIIQKDFLANNPLPNSFSLEKLTIACMGFPEREIWYFTLAVLFKERKKLQPTFILLLKEFMEKSDWWDVVDSASGIVAFLVRNFPTLKQEMDFWIEDENFWIRRVAIIHQLSYKKETDQAQLFRYIKTCAHEKEFFIQKGIGWALREYSKTNPEAVTHFIQENTLAPLSTREGLKWLKNKGKI